MLQMYNEIRFVGLRWTCPNFSVKSVENEPKPYFEVILQGKFALESEGFLYMIKHEDNNDRWLSIGEICAHLGVSSDTIYKWIEKQGLPAHRMGRLWKFQKTEVDAWVKSGQAGNGGNDKF